MKRILFSLIVVLFFSCEENMVVIPEAPVIDSARKVFVDELTGVACVGCPSGSEELANLKAIYGDNLVVMAIHSGLLTDPYSNSKEDFRTDAGDDLLTFLGNPAFKPIATINRKLYDGEFNILLSKSKWTGYIAEELAKPPKITVNIVKSFDEATRELSIRVSGIAQEDLTGDLRLSIFLTESEIADVQLTPEGLKEDYVHEHVMRDAVTSAVGDNFANQLNQGANYDVTYTYLLPEEWSPNHMEVVAFISLITSDSKEILQAEASYVMN